MIDLKKSHKCSTKYKERKYVKEVKRHEDSVHVVGVPGAENWENQGEWITTEMSGITSSKQDK